MSLYYASLNKSGTRHVIQPRHGIHFNYRLDGPPGPMLGKLVFRPGPALLDSGGSCVIGEFQPETGGPLPIAVKFVPDQVTPPRAASTHPTTTVRSKTAPVKVVGITPLVAVIGLCLIGGIVLVIRRVLKGGTAGKAVLLLVSLPVLLLILVVAGYSTARAGRAREELLRAKVDATQQRVAGAAVTLLLLGAGDKPMTRTAIAFIEAGGTVSKGKVRGQIASGLTDDLGFVHTFVAPLDRQWEIVVLRAGEEIMRSAPISTPVSANSPGGAPNYFLELQATGAAKLDAQLTPLSSEANQAARGAPSDEVMTYRLAMATMLQKLHQLPATSDEKGAVWLPVPSAAVPVSKRMEVAAQIDRLRRLIRDEGNGAAASPANTNGRNHPAAVTDEVRRKVDAFIQKYRGATDKEVMESAEFQQAYAKVREVLRTPEIQAAITKTHKDISVTKRGAPSMLVFGSKTAQGLDRPKNRALFEAAFSEDPEVIRAWLLSTLGGAVLEFAHDPALKESSGGVHLEAIPPKVRPAKGGAVRETNQPPSQVAVVTLVRREVKDKTPDGRDVAMTFEELRRDAKTSTATVKSVGGGSVASAMFIARGAYDIAKARGAAYFINLKEWEAEGGTRMYLIGFAPDKNVDPKTYFDLKEPLPEDKRLLFISVALYDHMFKVKPRSGC